MTIQGNRPLIGVVSDRRMEGVHPFHMVGEKYLQAVADGSDAYPVALPSLAEGFDVLDIIDRLDGIFNAPVRGMPRVPGSERVIWRHAAPTGARGARLRCTQGKPG